MDNILFSGENENLGFSVFDFKKVWMTFLKQILKLAKNASVLLAGFHLLHQKPHRIEYINNVAWQRQRFPGY
ncbi:MAG: hypothetical protein R3F53_25445 [Gammaproteobacteria bacterium]